MIPNHEHNSDIEFRQQTQIQSSLPSRSEVHRKKKKKKKTSKVKFPLIKLLVLFFILLPIGFYFVYTYYNDQPVYNQKASESTGDWNIKIDM